MHTYRLLIKIHNITGMKYLCKSTVGYWKRYPGSGTYWMRHLKVHSWNFRTILLFETHNETLFSCVAEEISEEFDIVNSNDWANLIVENGLDGIVTGFKRPDLVISQQGNKIAKGRAWYNNGYFEKMGYTCPAGYVKGRLKGRTRPDRVYACQQLGATSKGQHYFNNGSIQVRAVTCPTGFVLGKLK